MKETEAKTDIKFETVIKQCLDVEGSVICTLRDPQIKSITAQNPTELGASPYCAKCSSPKLKMKKRLLPSLLSQEKWMAFKFKTQNKELPNPKIIQRIEITRNQTCGKAISAFWISTPWILTYVKNQKEKKKEQREK